MAAHFVRLQADLDHWEQLSNRQWRIFEREGLSGWLANLNPRRSQNYVIAARDFFISYYYPETIALGYSRWGFKEVRHGGDVARFLLQCFPESRIIFLIRNIREVLASNAACSWYSESGGAEGVASLWVSNVEEAMNMADTRVLVLRYEDLVKDTETEMRSVFNHIGASERCWDKALLSQCVRGIKGQPRLGEQEFHVLERPDVRRVFQRSYSSEVGMP